MSRHRCSSLFAFLSLPGRLYVSFARMSPVEIQKESLHVVTTKYGCSSKKRPPEINERCPTVGLSRAPRERLQRHNSQSHSNAHALQKISQREDGSLVFCQNEMGKDESSDALGVNTTGSCIFLFYQYSHGRITDQQGLKSRPPGVSITTKWLEPRG